MHPIVKPAQFIALILMLLAANGRAETESELSLSLSYTVETANGTQTHCEISSTDNIETLQQLKNSECQLSNHNSTSSSAVVDVTFDKQKVKRYLITTREVILWARLAVHAYKLWDSGSSVLSPPICGCSGLPKKVTNLQRFFLAYYSLSFVQHLQRKIGPFFLTDKTEVTKPLEYESSEAESLKDSDEANPGTWLDYANRFPSSHLSMLIMDFAALKWDCRCAGYFTDKNGAPYFNGHLWMLFLDVANFATDLAIHSL